MNKSENKKRFSLSKRDNILFLFISFFTCSNQFFFHQIKCLNHRIKSIFSFNAIFFYNDNKNGKKALSIKYIWLWEKKLNFFYGNEFQKFRKIYKWINKIQRYDCTLDIFFQNKHRTHSRFPWKTTKRILMQMMIIEQKYVCDRTCTK